MKGILNKKEVKVALGFVLSLIGAFYFWSSLNGVIGLNGVYFSPPVEYALSGVKNMIYGVLGAFLLSGGMYFFSSLRKVKSGQASVEFLSTYGWALLIAIVAIGVLFQMGVFSPREYTTELGVTSAPFMMGEFLIEDNPGDDLVMVKISQGTGEVLNVGSGEFRLIGMKGNDIVICVTGDDVIFYDSNVRLIVLNCGPGSLDGNEFLTGNIEIEYTKGGGSNSYRSTGQVRDDVMEGQNSDVAECQNGINDDPLEDLLVDADDPGCWVDGVDPTTYNPADDSEGDIVPPACDDGVDNDNDGWIDYPADPGCDDLLDDDESNAATIYECSDGVDNDADGFQDGDDPMCIVWNNVEETAECQDGDDNDFDSLTDFSDDPGCLDENDDDENNCGNGVVDGGAGEICDTALPGNPCTIGGYNGEQACALDCYSWEACIATEFCGDGVMNGPEECDDGCNNGDPDLCEPIIDDGDGCSSLCLNELPEGNLYAHYNFNGDVLDSSGNGRHGSIVGNVDCLGAGYDGGGCTFGGSNDYVQIGAGSDFNDVCMEGCSFSSWVWKNSAGSYGSVVGRWDTPGDLFFNLGVTSLDKAQFQITLDGAYVCSISSSIDLPIGQWVHVVGVWETTWLRVYIDGTDVGSAWKDGCYDSGNPWTGSENTYIGIRGETGLVHDWDGMIDEIRIYDVPLTPTQVDLLYNEFP